MKMETDRLIIDGVRPSDRLDYFRNISHDRQVLETFICRYAETPEEMDFDPILNSRTLYFDETEESCEIGYGLGSEYWGRGYATEAVGCFLRYLTHEKGFRTVFASFFTGNDASRRVMEKCGMRYHHFSPKELTYLGRERDLVYYAAEAQTDTTSS